MRSFVSSLLPFIVLCAACTGVTEDGDSADSEVRKRIEPATGNAAFELGQPTDWNPADFQSWVPFRLGFTDSLSFAAPIDRPPGLHRLFMHLPGGAGQTAEVAVTLEAGMKTVYTPAALSVTRSRPLTMGANEDRILLKESFGREVLSNRISEGARTLLLAGTYVLENQRFPIPSSAASVVVVEGQKLDVVLPTVGVSGVFDSIDSEFPGTGPCTVLLLSDGTSVVDTKPLERGTTWIAPAGGSSIGIQCGERWETFRTDRDLSITMNRLEIDDIDVTSSTGERSKVRGSFVVTRNGKLIAIRQTHTGVDLPDGEYQVRSTAPNGTFHLTTVSFP